MSAFPWQAAENQNVQDQRSAYAESLKSQVEQRANAKLAMKKAQLEADRKDDERVLREQATFAAQAQGEIDAQRAREALVARREAFAAEQAAKREPTRADRIASYQAANVVSQSSIGSSIQLGDDGHNGFIQHSARNHRLPSGLMPAVNRTSVVTQSSIQGGILDPNGPAPPAARPLVAAIPKSDNCIFDNEPPQQRQQMSSAQAEAQAGLARAGANGVRPDQEADNAAAAIRNRARGSGSLW